MSSWLRKAAFAASATTAAAASSLTLERNPTLVDPDSTLGAAASYAIAAVRFTRSLHTAALIIADYRRLFAAHDEYVSPEYRARRSDVHNRSADRLLQLARRQGAVYVKIGQHVASMNHAVPKEYSSRLKLLEDRAATRPFWQIQRAVSRQLNIPSLSNTFSQFDPEPVAAASLAQVHRAVLRDGTPVAVKVQYPGLQALVEGDLASIRVLSLLLRYAFPFFDMQWVVDQFRTNLTQELDFIREARNAQRARALFSHDARISVPHVYTQLSSRRVLIMDYIDGFRVDDVDALTNANVDPSAVAQAVVDAFAHMIFVDGFVHCDPHAGNILVRAIPTSPSLRSRLLGTPPKSDFEVVLLDHGLYRELDDDFRQAYCRLWKGLVLRKGGDVAAACQQLHAPGLENLFSIMLLNRSWNSAKRVGTDIRVKMTRDEMRQLRSDLKQSGISFDSDSDLSSLLAQIPDDLFLVFKMNALVRNVNKSLGARIDRFKVNARYAVRGMWWKQGKSMEDMLERMKDGDVVLASTGERDGGDFGVVSAMQDGADALAKWVGQAMDRMMVEANLIVLDLVRWALSWWLVSKQTDEDFLLG